MVGKTLRVTSKLKKKAIRPFVVLILVFDEVLNIFNLGLKEVDRCPSQLFLFLFHCGDVSMLCIHNYNYQSVEWKNSQLEEKSKI